MKAYLADKTRQFFVEDFITTSGVSIDYKTGFDVLKDKECFLIDVFDTFIKRLTTEDEGRTAKRLGIMAYLRGEKVTEEFIIKGQEPRTGFKDFLTHYKSNNVQIGIHSDGIYQEWFLELNKFWGFEGLVDQYFLNIASISKDEWKFNNSFLMDHKYHILDGFGNKYIKNFGSMINEMGVDKEKTIIIGDGASDIVPAVHYDVDLLIVPGQASYPEFDFRELIETLK
jgi:2-hydroxy-3-keto-5-methylthiopentenyl-1-phosphate phosphatase